MSIEQIGQLLSAFTFPRFCVQSSLVLPAATDSAPDELEKTGIRGGNMKMEHCALKPEITT